MKKIILLLGIVSISLMTSGCNQYFKAEKVNGNNDIYYGAYNRRDRVHSDVVFFKKNSNVVCDGTLYLYNATRGYNLSDKMGDAQMNLGCNDATVINANWKLRKSSYKDGYAEGVDQFNNVYKFTSIKRYEYHKNVKGRPDFIGDKSTNNYLKY